MYGQQQLSALGQQLQLQDKNKVQQLEVDQRLINGDHMCIAISTASCTLGLTVRVPAVGVHVHMFIAVTAHQLHLIRRSCDCTTVLLLLYM
jgi:hypothetical protein